MADFLIAFKRRIPIEGGWCADITDDGCWNGGKQGIGELTGTNWGITSPEYSKYLGCTVTLAEMKAIPIEHAMDIFRKNYWDKIRGNEIEDQGIANDIYDTAVNQGLVTAILQAQEVKGLVKTGRVTDYFIDILNNK